MARYRRRRQATLSSEMDSVSGIATDLLDNPTEVSPYAMATAFLSLLEKTDSIIASQELTCEMTGVVPYAATDGEAIYFNRELMEGMFQGIAQNIGRGTYRLEESTNTLTELRGLNYHELGHVMYSPRKTSIVFKKIQSGGFYSPFTGMAYDTRDLLRYLNILEDSRMERLLIATYPAVMPYIRLCAYKYIQGALECAVLPQHQSYGTLNSLTGAQAEAKFERDKAIGIGMTPSLVNSGEMEKRAEVLDRASAFNLIYGRKYLPLYMREAAEERFLSALVGYEMHKHWSSARYAGMQPHSTHPPVILDANGAKKVVEELKSIVDKFLPLVHPADSEEMVDCSVALANWWEGLIGTTYTPVTSTGDGHALLAKGRASVGDQKEAQEAAEAMDELREQHEAEEAADHADSQNRRHQDSNDDADSDAEADDDADQQESGTGTGSGDGNDQRSDANDSVGSPRESDARKTMSELEDAVNEQLDELREDSLRMFAKSREKAHELRYERVMSDLANPTHTVSPASSYRAVSGAISHALAMLRADTDNQWERGIANGSKMNFSRVIQSRGSHLEVFDQWLDEGDERPDCEVVILLDTSGSMGQWAFDFALAESAVANGEYEHYMKWLQGDMSSEHLVPEIVKKAHATQHGFPTHSPESYYRARGLTDSFYSAFVNGEKEKRGALIDHAAQAMWAVKSACQKHDIECTVLGYESSVQALMSRNSRVTSVAPVWGTGGSTNPLPAIAIAAEVMRRSDAKHKLVITITDGDWDNYARTSNGRGMGREAYEEAVKAMIAIGVSPYLVCLANGAEGEYHEGRLRFLPSYPSWVDERKRNCQPFAGQYGFPNVLIVRDTTELTRSIGKMLIKGVLKAKN
jgi:hypothetical protein